MTLSADASPIIVEDDPRDDPADRLLCGCIGAAVCRTFPDWEWRVEILPAPNNRTIIVRNLTLDFRGKYGFAIDRNKLPAGRDETAFAVWGARCLLERYEHLKRHAGRLHPDDFTPQESLFLKPET